MGRDAVCEANGEPCEAPHKRRALTGKFSERTIQQQIAWKRKYGDNGKEDPPVPIPNTEVKLFYADGTWLETTWESRKLPNKIGK